MHHSERLGQRVETEFSGLHFRKATVEDSEIIRSLEERAFGVCIHRTELSQILWEGKGEVYLAFQDGQAVAYLVLLFDNIDEERLQSVLWKVEDRAYPRFMHDDTHIVKGNEVYFHLLGVDPDYQNQGVGRKLLKFVLDQLPQQVRNLERTACVRVNNLLSLRLVTRVLGVSMLWRQSITKRQFGSQTMFGSRETNFHASSAVKPVTDASMLVSCPVWYPDMVRPESNDLLIPISHGEEDELEARVVAQIDALMSRDKAPGEGDYVMRGVFTGDELGLDADSSYLYFSTRMN